MLRGHATERPAEEDIEQDLREFRRLRNYYRRNFANGPSDEAFILWIETMCEQENARKSKISSDPYPTLARKEIVSGRGL
jgi:hypothetical protein